MFLLSPPSYFFSLFEPAAVFGRDKSSTRCFIAAELSPVDRCVASDDGLPVLGRFPTPLFAAFPYPTFCR